MNNSELLAIYQINAHILKGIEDFVEEFVEEFVERINEYSIYDVDEISGLLQKYLSSLRTKFHEELEIELLLSQLNNLIEKHTVKKC